MRLTNWICLALIGATCALPATTLAQPPPAPPANARAALDRATALYTFGDMEEVVASVRPVVEGDLPATDPERAEALRLLGSSLFLTGRVEGARVAFLDLLRLDPGSRLDPKTTRPDVLGFFQQLQAERAAELDERARSRTRDQVLWSFAPPFAQFRGGRNLRGWLLVGTAGTAFATAAATKIILESSERPDKTHPDTERARTLKAVNYASLGLLGATYVVGVVEALLNRDSERPAPRVTLAPMPGGVAVAGRF